MADKDYKFLEDSALGRIMSQAADSDSYPMYKALGAGIYDLGAVPINKATEFLTGYNPGFSGSKFFGRKDDAGNLIDQDTAYFGIPTDATQGFDARDKRLANEERKKQRSISRMNQGRLMDTGTGSMEDDYKGPFPKKKPTIKKEKVKAKTEKEKFVEKDTVLGRMFDKRIRPGAETSSRNKMFTYMDEIGKNLVERRVKGDKSSTLDRVLGGVIEGKDAVITKDKDKVAQRLENIMTDQKVRKEEATIAKLQAEADLESYGYNVANMDSTTKAAHFEVLSRLGSESIGTGPYQIALNEILTSNKSRDMLKNMEGYSNILQVLSQEQEGSDAYNNAQAIKNEYERVMGIESMDSSSATSSKEYTE